MRTLFCFAFAMFFGLIGCSVAPAPQSAAIDLAQKYPQQWPVYSRSAGAARFSPLTNIDRQNVNQLEVAWTFHTGELEHVAGSSLAEELTFECTPLVLDGVMYLVTGSNRALAIDAETGKLVWSYDPGIDLNGNYSETAARGSTIWEPADGKPHGRRKLFYGTLDGRLIGLDAQTGKPLAKFGKAGEVNLHPSAMPAGPIAPDQTMAAMKEYETGQKIPKKSPADFSSIEAYNSWAFGSLVVPQVTSPPVVVGDLIVVGTAIADNFSVENGLGIVQAFSVHDGHPAWSWDPIPRQPEDPGYATWSRHDVGGSNAWPPLSVDPQRSLIFVPTTSASPDYYGGDRLGCNAYSDSLVALHAKTGKLAWSFQIVRHDLWDYDGNTQLLLVDIERDGKPVQAIVQANRNGYFYILDRTTGAFLGAEAYTENMNWATIDANGRPVVSENARNTDGVHGPVCPGTQGGTNAALATAFNPNLGLTFVPVIEACATYTVAEVEFVPGAPFMGGIPAYDTDSTYGHLSAIDVATGQTRWRYRDDTGLLAGVLSTEGGVVFTGNVAGEVLALDAKTGERIWSFRAGSAIRSQPIAFEVDGVPHLAIAAGGFPAAEAFLFPSMVPGDGQLFVFKLETPETRPEE